MNAPVPPDSTPVLSFAQHGTTVSVIVTVYDDGSGEYRVRYSDGDIATRYWKTPDGRFASDEIESSGYGDDRNPNEARRMHRVADRWLQESCDPYFQVTVAAPRRGLIA